MKQGKRKNQEGVALVVFSLALFTVLLPMVALGIDMGLLYLIHSQVATAADAAALAGGRSLSGGSDINTQTPIAKAAMQAFFNANFPPGYWGTTGATFTLDVKQTALRTRTATIDVTMNAPLYFMRVLGTPTSMIAAHGQATRRDVNIILVLDRSDSMRIAGVCPQMVQQARNFVAQFTDGRDTLGLITFHHASSLDYAPNINFKSSTPSLDTVLSQLQCGGYTNTTQALWQAYQQIKAVNQPGVLNLIVLFTDGQPNGVAVDLTGLNPLALLPIHLLGDTRYLWNQTGTLGSVGISACLAGTATYGGIFSSGGAGNDMAVTGDTIGVVAPTASGISDVGGSAVSGTIGCNFGQAYGRKMRDDVAYIPAQDHWGNSTSGFKGSQLYTTGPYSGQLRTDTPMSIAIAAINTADNAATRIRNDATYAPVIYTIGLGGTTTDPIDATFLERVANDPRSPIYDNSKAAGQFVYASDISQLGLAFQSVASQILRLSQ